MPYTFPFFLLLPLFILDFKEKGDIMALPKRRHSSSRTGKRRSHDALNPPNIPRSEFAKTTSGNRSKKFICPHCKQIKKPHTVCHNCGYYRGKQVIAVERA